MKSRLPYEPVLGLPAVRASRDNQAFLAMPGMTILHYEFLEKIGAGAMGEVFKAHDKRLNRHVAIKALPYAMAADPERRKRFTQEAQTASALNHPNIVTIHDVFHEGDTHFIVMEYVAGRTLLESIPPKGMPIGQMLLSSAQMASALSAAHEAGIVHRDFKPANVMIGNSGLVKVLDFGLARQSPPANRPPFSWLFSRR
jgi:eukaryotic-like serine/threonine-protein kinase